MRLALVYKSLQYSYVALPLVWCFATWSAVEFPSVKWATVYSVVIMFVQLVTSTLERACCLNVCYPCRLNCMLTVFWAQTAADHAAYLWGCMVGVVW